MLVAIRPSIIVMGLDNIPNTYACQSKGTAVVVPKLDDNGEQIFDEFGLPETWLSCEATMEAGGCPWKTVLGHRKGQVLGLIGTPCWYRGKYGYWLLEKLDMALYGETLYGEGEEVGAGYISENDLHSIADAITESYTEEDGVTRLTEIIIDGENLADDIWYLADWCRFTALYCNGAQSWY